MAHQPKRTICNVFSKVMRQLKYRKNDAIHECTSPYDDEVFTTVDGKPMTFRQFNQIMYEHFEMQRHEEKSQYPDFASTNGNA